MPNDARPTLVAIASGPRLRRALAWIAGILVAIAVIGFLVLPWIARPRLEHALSTALDRKVTIERLAIDPFALSTTLSGVTIAERGEGPPVLKLDELYVNAEMMSLFRWAPVINELKLTRPSLHILRNEDKSYNFSDLIEQALAQPAGPPPHFSVSNIQIVDGSIDFDDRPEHRQHKLTALNLGIPFLSSLPSQTEIKVEPRFSARINGQAVAMTGETRPFLDTHETVLHWELAGLPLPLYLDYVPVKLPAKVESGRLDARIDFSFVGRGANPPQLTLAGDLTLSDLALNEHSGAPLLRVPSLAVAVDKLDLVGNNADVRSIRGDGVQVDVRREGGGEVNLATLVPPASAPAKGERPFRFRVGSVALNHGVMHVADTAVTPTFAATLNDVSIDIKNLASGSDQKATVALSFTTDAGEKLSHRGTLSLSPVGGDGRLEITGLKLARLFPYYASALNLTVDAGTLDAATDVRFTAGASELLLTNLEGSLHDVSMRLPDDKQPLWRIPTLTVQGGTVDVSKQTVSFDSIESQGAAAAIRRDAEGAFNFARIVRRSQAGPAAGTGGQGWRIDARKLALSDLSASFNDESVAPPAAIVLTRVSLTGENLSNAVKAKGQASLQATVNKRGTLSLSGPIETAPFAGKFNAVAKNVDLVPFAGYISQSARLVLTGGAASAHGTLDVASGTPLHGAFKGAAVLAGVAALDEANKTDLLKWKTLSLGSIDMQLEPLAVNIGDIALDDFFARLILNETGEFNLQQLARGRAPATAPPVPTGAPKTVEVASPPTTATTWLKLGKATLTSGNIYFTDHFVRPNYSANLTRLEGGLSSLAFDKPADLELHGRVQESAPVEITGRINPLAKNLFLDIKANASDIELPPLSPYSGKYVGYGIEKGKLSMKVHYLIDERKLTAENSVILDQLTFGGKVESPEAIKVPVLLAVALLKDRNGVIQFDLPVSGSLDDPEFSVGGIVFRALINLLAKIVTSPFALLGSLGGHGAELAYIEFAPGSAALDTASQEKIKTMAKALTDRPALKLDIAGRADPTADRDGLKHAAIERQIRLLKFNELERRGEPPASVDATEVPAAEYEALLTRVYKDAKFDKPRNAIGFAKDLPRAEMETLLLANTTISDEDLRLLAERRAQAVHASLVDEQHVPGERVFLVAPKLDAEGIKDKGKATRVDFALR
ncbi:MAG TPA: DUF748 domain-containing protein [Casimicrobiaceae bacterium]|nr:DUF748 domain-containing protein [Casimicrobiaceae bacterium]